MSSNMTMGTIAGYVYEDGVGFVGVAEIELPNVDFETFEMKGLGLLGSAEYGALAQFKPMKMKMKFTETGEEFYVLSDQRIHDITIEVAKQLYEFDGREIPVTGISYNVKFEPLTRQGGTVAPATQQNVEVEGSVFAFKEYINGVLEQHIDVRNFIYIGHDGVDRAAPIRKALKMPN